MPCGLVPDADRQRGDVRPGPAKEILLVLDGAGWHVAKDLAVPDHLHPAFLPSYSPELQPAERL